MKKANLLLILIASCFGISGAQNFQTVRSIELSVSPGSSYVVYEYGKLLPGCTITNTNGEFFLRAITALTEVQPDRNFIVSKSIVKDNIRDESEIKPDEKEVLA